MGAAEEQLVWQVSRRPWSVNRVGNVVSARFSGHLDRADGEASAARFVETVGDSIVDALFDIRDMTGYDSAARRAWASKLKPISGQLRCIEIRGGNALVKMGGSVLGAVLGVPVRFS